MANDSKNKESEKEQLLTNKTYRSRLTYLKHAQEFSQRGEITKAVEKYSQYLNVLAAFKKTTEENLSPKHFDEESDITEMLLISHAYWDLAKAYDRNYKLHGESIRCMQQFIKFTDGFKYQYVNAQMVKKFIKKKQARNAPAFKECYSKLRVSQKGCFVSTYCLGPHAKETIFFREYRDKELSKSTTGRLFIKKYYAHSPQIVHLAENFFPLRFFLKRLCTPILKSLYHHLSKK